MVVPGEAGADGADHGGEMRRAAIGEVVAVHRGDDHMLQAELGDGVADLARLVRHRAGRAGPVFTLQKAQARVQVSPMIIMVACFFSQHSPIFGQPASSHTVMQAVLRG